MVNVFSIFHYLLVKIVIYSSIGRKTDEWIAPHCVQISVKPVHDDHLMGLHSNCKVRIMFVLLWAEICKLWWIVDLLFSHDWRERKHLLDTLSVSATSNLSFAAFLITAPASSGAFCSVILIQMLCQTCSSLTPPALQPESHQTSISRISL